MASVRRFALPLLGLLFVFTFIRGDPNVATANKICSGNSYGSSDPYANSVSYVLKDMATVTANQPGYDHYTHSPYAEATAHGHAFCNSWLSHTNCAICVTYAKSSIVDECSKRMGVQMQLQDCKMRYKNYQFWE